MRVPVNGIQLNVEQRGSGPPLLLLHGFTGSVATWAPLMDALAGRFRTVAVDLHGHGGSDCPADPARYRLDRAAGDVLALLDRLDIGRFALLGYSLGGRLALHLALAAPGRAHTLVLESASPGILDPQERRGRVESDERLARILEREGIEVFVERWEQHPLFRTQARLPSTVRAALRAQRLRSDPRGLANSLRGAGAGIQEPLVDRLRELRQPTLVLVGELDARYRELGLMMANAMPAATLAVVEGAGHAVHLERPEEFLEIVLRHIGLTPNRLVGVGGDRRQLRRGDVAGYPLGDPLSSLHHSPAACGPSPPLGPDRGGPPSPERDAGTAVGDAV
ncbi:MAG: 2-succinyl-6-hydroxy-2,4-cyclohexadiene-1-carboxylate synthase [Chloroflexi bacterium]|nr:2-succinyl-6-hydroxy-2,4-cyclohexadiene-1-carboxylate synthase [Chloroflexota bacterium]